MSEPSYSALAPYYEQLNSEVDYDGIAEFIDRTIKQRRRSENELTLDLGCGTGTVTRRLAALGYDMIGVDCSEDMLAEAQRRSTEVHGGKHPLCICQDIRSLELYGAVGAAVCCLDGLNYLCGRGDLDRCLGALANYLEPGGVFIFDVNTPHKFRDIYGTRDYVIEDEGVLCAWENDYNEKTGICDFYLSVFSERENGLWERSDEVQRERCYTRRVLENALARNGFAVCEVLGAGSHAPAVDEDERWVFVTERVRVG